MKSTMILLAMAAAMLLATRVAHASLLPCDETAVCPAGQFGLKAEDGTVACMACPILTFKATEGAGCCEPCLTNLKTPGATACSCPAGTYKNSASTTFYDRCRPCVGPKDYTSAPDSDACLVCGDGYRASLLHDKCICDVGYKLAADGVTCVPTCPAGQQNVAPDETAPLQCEACPAGTVNPVSGGTCTACTDGRVPNTAATRCVCPAGAYLLFGVCKACPRATIAPTAGSLCKPCPIGFSSTDGLACNTCYPGYAAGTDDAGNLTCASCIENYFAVTASPALVCYKCPANTFAPAGTQPKCCPAGQTLVAGACQ